MATQAQVTSVEAIEAFRASLILYLSKARPVLEEVGEDVMRTRLWLENEQRINREGLVRRRIKDLEQAQQALFSARIASLREASTAEQEAVHRAKRALASAEDQLAKVKRWDRDFGGQAEPLVKQLEKLRSVLFNDLPHAALTLAQIVKTLDAYAETALPSAAARLPTVAPAETSPPESAPAAAPNLPPESPA